MTLVRKSLPLLPLDGRELLSAVREDSCAELDLAEGYLYAAQEALMNQVSRAAHRVQLELTLPCFPSTYGESFVDVPFTSSEYASVYRGGIELLVLPLARVDSVKYYDADDVLQTWDPANYNIVDGGVSRPSVIYPATDITWPVTKSRPDAVVITFWAGEVTQATYQEVSAPFVGTDGIATVDGYEFAVDDIITLSHSGNSNELLGPVAAGFTGVNPSRQSYHVTASTGSVWEVSDSSGGSPVALSTPVACTALVGTLSPLVKRAMISVATDWWLNRCPLDECSCEAGESGKVAGMMSLLKWNFAVGR
jgi:hypothetical protein